MRLYKGKSFIKICVLLATYALSGLSLNDDSYSIYLVGLAIEMQQQYLVGQLQKPGYLWMPEVLLLNEAVVTDCLTQQV